MKNNISLWYELSGVSDFCFEKPVNFFVPEITKEPVFKPKEDNKEVVSEEIFIDIVANDISELKFLVSSYDNTSLKKMAKNMVFGDGNENADVLFISDSPSPEDDVTGNVFSGEMGEFFDKMINSIGLDRTSCYICNIVPYKPLSIGFNMASEVKRFMPFTKKLIELVKPKLIIILGGVALKAITKSDKGLSSLRGEFFKYKNNDDVEIMSCAIFHPSYLIKNPIAKRVAYKDLLEIKKTLNNL